MKIDLDEFEYHLPAELIAQQPPACRDRARLLVLGRPDGPRTKRGGAVKGNANRGTPNTSIPQTAVDEPIMAVSALEDRVFNELTAVLPPAALLVFNDTAVIPARLRARRATGGQVEIMLCRPQELPFAVTREPCPPISAPCVADAIGQSASGSAEHSRGGRWSEVWSAFCRPARRLRPGQRLFLQPPQKVDTKAESSASEPDQKWDPKDAAAVEITVLEKQSDGQIKLRFSGPLDDHHGPHGSPDTMAALCRRWGETPLPPYIRRQDGVRPTDRARYQTVYARNPGAVAAPTAGLHFTPKLLTRLDRAGFERTQVTLHVGPGTFRPIKVDDPAKHVMHREWYHLPPKTVDAVRRAKHEGRAVVAVGTTTVRVLESCAGPDGGLQAGQGETDLFIYPGFDFRVIDGLVTNFHLPRSTLLLLVCAFGGTQRVLAAYRHAVARRYRFYSYGDAMLVYRDAARSRSGHR
jgi:S-adenosylmethionine:tRNA ribosyltransferase-isomerase